jgi:hypothetical protein
LNGEILKGIQFSFDDADTIDDDNQSIKEEKEEEKESAHNIENVFSTLIDQSPQPSNIGKSIAILLPLVLTASLVISYEIVASGGVKMMQCMLLGTRFGVKYMVGSRHIFRI